MWRLFIWNAKRPKSPLIQDIHHGDLKCSLMIYNIVSPCKQYKIQYLCYITQSSLAVKPVYELCILAE